MKRIIAIAALCLLLAPVAEAELPRTIGAESVGYGATVDDKGDLFTGFWAGLRTLHVSEQTAVYACYQHLGKNGGLNGDGAKAVLVSQSESLKWLYLMADMGVVEGLAKDADGSTAMAVTTGGGFAVSLSEYISPFVYFSAYDAGERFTWSIHAGMAIKDVQKLAGLDW